MGAKFNLISVGKQQNLELPGFIPRFLESVLLFVEKQIGKLQVLSIIEPETGNTRDIRFQNLQDIQLESISKSFLFFLYPQVLGNGTFSLSFEDDFWFACLSMNDRLNVSEKMPDFWDSLKKQRPIFIFGGEELELDASKVNQILNSQVHPFEDSLCEIVMINGKILKEVGFKPKIKGIHDGLQIIEK
jgi:hypothetical protein